MQNKNSELLYFLKATVIVVVLTIFVSCGNQYFKNDYEDNSPTSGKLKLYYDEGLYLHIKNQVYTFEAEYPNAKIELTQTSENEAVDALYKDSCKLIFISRLLSEKEKKAFSSIKLDPKYSAVAKSGVALITNINTPVDQLHYSQVIDLLTKPFVCKDSISNENKLNVLLDKKNSAVMHYLLDSVLKDRPFSENCNVLGSSIEAINFVANNKNTIAFIDFAWLSDVDDSTYKANKSKVKFIAVGNQKTNESEGKYELPSQSSFKRGTYPFIRTVYMIRRSGEFTLGKGFESYVAGPKGQVTFLKQGLLPTKQQERSVHVNFEPIKTN